MTRAQLLYQEFVNEAINSTDTPWEKLIGQVVLGKETFLAEIKELLSGKENIAEIPRIQRYLARPTLTELFPPEVMQSKNVRNQLIYDAHIVFAYSLKDIANILDLHYTTISKVINKTDFSRPDPDVSVRENRTHGLIREGRVKPALYSTQCFCYDPQKS